MSQNKEINALRKEVQELKLTLNQVHDHNFNISPIPSADELSRLEQIEKGITNRILSMAEQQLERTHTHNMALVELEATNQDIAKQDLEDTTKARTRAQWMSFVFMVMGFGTAVYMASQNQELGAIAALVGAASPIIIAFLASHKK